MLMHVCFRHVFAVNSTFLLLQAIKTQLSALLTCPSSSRWARCRAHAHAELDALLDPPPPLKLGCYAPMTKSRW